MRIFGDKAKFAIGCELADGKPTGAVSLWIAGVVLPLQETGGSLEWVTLNLAQFNWQLDELKYAQSHANLDSRPPVEVLDKVMADWRAADPQDPGLSCCKWIFPTGADDSVESAYWLSKGTRTVSEKESPREANTVSILWRMQGGDKRSEVHRLSIDRVVYWLVVKEFCDWSNTFERSVQLIL